MIRMRNDDVLLPSGNAPTRRFWSIHNTFAACDKVIHVPTILVTEIQSYPEEVMRIKAKTELGEMEPQLHGFTHIDYGDLEEKDIRIHLDMSLSWFKSNLDYTPTKWYTPWGAMNESIVSCAKEFDLEAIGVDKHFTIERVHDRLRRGESSLKDIEGKEILLHWWNRGLRWKRLVEVITWGSWEKAALSNPEFF